MISCLPFCFVFVVYKSGDTPPVTPAVKTGVGRGLETLAGIKKIRDGSDGDAGVDQGWCRGGGRGDRREGPEGERQPEESPRSAHDTDAAWWRAA